MMRPLFIVTPKANMKWMARGLGSLAVALLAGCFLRSWPVVRGDGDIASEKRAVSDFNELEARGALSIQWTGGDPDLAITADRNLLPHIKTVLAGKTLSIYPDASLSPTSDIKIVLASTALEKLTLTGATRLLAGQITGDELKLVSTGAVSARIGGEVKDLEATLTGASQLQASKLSAVTARLTLTGAASAEVAVAEHLRVAITGAGSVTYSGTPTLDRTILGAGSIRHRP